MARYFYTSLGRRPLTLSGKVIKFEICSLAGGRASGVYEATDPEEITVLDDAVRGRRGVQEITKEVFDDALEKKKATQRSRPSSAYSPRLVRPQITPDLAVAEKAGVVRAEGKQPAPSQQTAFNGLDARSTPSIAALMAGRVQRVNPPKPFAASDAKTVKASDRATRAKVRVARAAVETR